MIADEAKLGSTFSTENCWIVAQEELDVYDDWSNMNDRMLNSFKRQIICWVIINNVSAVGWQSSLKTGLEEKAQML